MSSNYPEAPERPDRPNEELSRNPLQDLLEELGRLNSYEPDGQSTVVRMMWP